MTTLAIVQGEQKFTFNTLKPITQNMIFYVSNVGDDSTADGTTSKPFKTLQACYNYIRLNYYFGAFVNVTISILTPLTEQDIFFLPVVASNKNTNSYITVKNSSGGEVILKNVSIRDSMVYFDSVTFAPTENGTALNVVSYGRGYLKNCKLDINNNFTYGATVSYFAYLELIDTFEVNGNNNTGRSLFNAYAHSRINIGSLKYIGNLNCTVAFIDVSQLSDVYFLKSGASEFNGSVNGKKYVISQMSYIYTNGKGADFLPGSTAGIVLDNSVYI